MIDFLFIQYFMFRAMMRSQLLLPTAIPNSGSNSNHRPAIQNAGVQTVTQISGNLLH